MKVFVYRNLRKKCLSVRCVKTGRVIAYVDQILIKDAIFKVSQAGRARVLKQRQKNVHAGVQGIWLKKPTRFSTFAKATYNPYKHPTFINTRTLKPVLSANLALVTTQGVLI